MLQEGPVLLVHAAGRLNQQVARLSGRSLARNPHRPGVNVLAVNSDHLEEKKIPSFRGNLSLRWFMVVLFLMKKNKIFTGEMWCEFLMLKKLKSSL